MPLQVILPYGFLVAGAIMIVIFAVMFAKGLKSKQ